MDRLNEEIKKKPVPNAKEKSTLPPRLYALCHMPMIIMAKFYELKLKMLYYPLYSPDLGPSDYYLFTYLKSMLQGERFASNDKVIAEANAYFEGKDKSFYKKRYQNVREALE